MALHNFSDHVYFNVEEISKLVPGQLRDESVVDEEDLSVSQTLAREEQVRTLQVLVNVAHRVQVLKAVDLKIGYTRVDI